MMQGGLKKFFLALVVLMTAGARPAFAVADGTGNDIFTGNVGIGTTTTVATLQVGIAPAIPAGSNPAAAIKGNLIIDGKLYGDGAGLTGLSGSISGLNAGYIPQASSSTTVVDSVIYQDASGNVGIGSTVPYGQLSFVQPLATDKAIYIKSPASGAGNAAGRAITFVNVDGTELFYVSGSAAVSGSSYTAGNNGGFTLSGSWGNWSSAAGGNRTTLATAYGINITNTSVPLTDTNPTSNVFMDIQGRINQSGINAYTLLNVNATETAIGSGQSYLMKVGVGDISKVVIDRLGNTGIGSTTPQAKLEVVGSGSTTGVAFQVDNSLYAPKVTVLDNGNVGIGTTLPSLPLSVGSSSQFTVDAVGVVTAMKFSINPTYVYMTGSGVTTYYVKNDSTTTPLTLNGFGGNSTSADGVDVATTNPFTNTSGTRAAFAIKQAYNQTSGTAANTDLLISRTQSNVGSGEQLLIDAQVYSTSQFKVSNTGVGYFAGNLGLGSTVPLATLQVGSAPTIPEGSSPAAAIKGNLIVDGKLYGDGSGLTGLSGSISGLTTWGVPRASSATSIVDSGIYTDSNGNVGIGTSLPRNGLDVAHPSYAGVIVARAQGNTDPFTAVQHSAGRDYSGAVGAIVGGGDTFGAFHAGVASNNAASKNMYALIGQRRYNSGWSGGGVTAVAAGMYLPGMAFAGQSNGTAGTGMTIGASILGVVDGTVASGVLPSAIVFNTSLTNATGLTEKMRVTSGGNVGIGSTTPQAKLEVVGSGSTTGVAFQIDNSLYTPKFTVLDNGNVGVGTAVPLNRLSVFGDVDVTRHAAIGPDSGVDKDYPEGGTQTTIFDARETHTDMSMDYVNGGYFRLTLNPSVAPAADVYGMNFEIFTDELNAQDFGHLAAGYNMITHAGSGVLDQAHATDSYIFVDAGTVTSAVASNNTVRAGGGAITSAYGSYNEIIILSGSIQNAYGVYSVVGASAAINPYSFYAAGMAPSYFAGNIGIGTTVPSVALHVGVGAPNAMPITGSDAYIAGNLEVDGKIYGDGSMLTGLSGGLSGLNAGYIPQASSATTVVDSTIYQNGSNIGIGTVTPSQNLEVRRSIAFGGGALDSSYLASGLGYGCPGCASYATLQLYSSGGSTTLTNYYGSGAININAAGGTNAGVRLQTKSTTRLLVHAEGNVGVGTTTPVALLHVGGGGTVPDAMNITGSDAYIVGNLEVDGKIYGDGSGLTGVGGLSGLNAGYIPQASSATTVVDSAIYQNGSNIGIGSTSPAGTLEIQKSGAYSPFMVSSSAAADGDYLILSSGGSFGIGTTAPTAKLDVRGTSVMSSNTGGGTAALTLYNGDNRNYYMDLQISNDGTGTGITNFRTGGDYQRMYFKGLYMSFLTGTYAGGIPERMRLDTSGNLGIGTTVPVAKLEVVGSGTTTGVAFQIDDNLYAPKVTVFDNGNVGIGTVAPRAKLEVNGTILTSEASLATAATIDVDWNSGNQQYVTLNQAGHTINFSNYKVGQILRLVVCQDNDGARTVTSWDSSIVWSGGNPPSLTATGLACDIVSFVCTNAKGSVKNFGSSVANF